MMLLRYFGMILGSLGIQNYVTLFLFILLSYIYYYFEFIVKFVNRFFVSKYEYDETYFKGASNYLCRNPDLSEKDQIRVKLFFNELLRLNYHINYLYQNGEYNKIKDIYNAIEREFDGSFCVYAFNESNEKVIGVINVKKLLLVSKIKTESCDVLLFNIIGTNNFEEIITDIRIETSSIGNTLFKNTDAERSIQIHDGFFKTISKSVDVSKTDICNYDFGVDTTQSSSIIKVIVDIIQQNADENTKIYFSGHSLGGALALLCYLVVVSVFSMSEKKIIDLKNLFLYTYGSPNISNVSFEKIFKKTYPEANMKNIHMIINDNDIITQIPFGSLLYLFNYTAPFPNSIERITKDSYHSYLNLFSGIKNHFISNYYQALLNEYNKL